MAVEFKQTLLSLESASRGRRIAYGVAVTVVVGWIVWLAWGALGVYVSSTEARIEVSALAHSVQCEVSGVVTHSELRLGRFVQKGDVLVVLDGRSESLRLDKLKAQLKSARASLKAAEQELATEKQAEEVLAKMGNARLRAAWARARVARVAAQTTAREAEMMKSLKQHGVVSKLDELKTHGEASKNKAQLSAESAVAQETAASKDATTIEQQALIARLERGIVDLRGRIDDIEGEVDLMEYQADRRTIRAPISGVIAEIVNVTPGETVEAGRKLAAILPEGDHFASAEFGTHEALGRIRPGQDALLRLDAFPWAQYGVVKARVARVASEGSDGKIRAEFTIIDKPEAVSLVHGLTGTVDVQVETVTPAVFLLRAAGQWLTRGAEAQAEAEDAQLPTVPTTSPAAQ